MKSSSYRKAMFVVKKELKTVIHELKITVTIAENFILYKLNLFINIQVIEVHRL